MSDLVAVRPPRTEDLAAYMEAVSMSATRLSTFAVPDPHNLGLVIESQSPAYRSFMVWAREPAGAHGLVGRINIANVVRGAFQSATVGYDAYDPYAGQGLFVEGLRLVIDIAFTDEPQGMGLHRLEANIQPANVRSAGLVRSLGLVHEGFSRDFLHLPGADGRRGWRDHDRYAILAPDWPAAPYRHQPPRRLAAIVHGPPVLQGPSFAALLAADLGLPLFGGTAPLATLCELLRASTVGGVVETGVVGPELRMGLARAGLDPKVVPVFEPAGNPSKADVVRAALAVRAAYT
ncbi:MAG: GNAT family N-acetyltransferase [Terracoccus sp.]